MTTPYVAIPPALSARVFSAAAKINRVQAIVSSSYTTATMLKRADELLAEIAEEINEAEQMPITYRNYHIAPGYFGFDYWHDDYDGPGDIRRGHEDSIAACRDQIDQIEEELAEPRPARPAHTYDIATVTAMAAYELDPGHSDLDSEQPMSVKVGDQWVRCTLGDIRMAKRLARASVEAGNSVSRDHDLSTCAAGFEVTGPQARS
jgi:hypothetical protein